MKVKIHNTVRVYSGFFKLDLATLQFEQYDGSMSQPVKRLNVYREDAVAVLLYNSAKKEFIFVEQFRYPIFTSELENAWTIECVAGATEKGTPLETAVAEVEEEVGYKITQDELLLTGRCYPSPGGTSERIYLYVADVTETHQVSQGGGLDSEHEDIKVVNLSYDETYQMVKDGKICDAKTLLLLAWFKENRLEKQC